MNISNLGAGCYIQFKCERVMEALRGIEGIDNLEHCQLSKEQAHEATRRAHARLELYYEHLKLLVQSVNHEDRNKALDSLGTLALEDKKLISATYDKLTTISKTRCIPGIALFLHAGGRSYALLPEMEESSDKKEGSTVYMSSTWSDIIFELEAQNPKGLNGLNDLKTRIKRSNRLWQRERWSVLPAAKPSLLPTINTAEPFGVTPDAAFFNNIMLHDKTVDGWVDTFWGVQSGLRLPISIPDSEGSKLVILLTSYLPDAFKEWDTFSNKYPEPVPDEITHLAIERLEEVFEKELRGLSLAANLLKDVAKSETNLLESGMKMIAHYVHKKSDTEYDKPDWEGAAIDLLHELRQVSSDSYQRLSALENPMNVIFTQMENEAQELPIDEMSEQWKVKLKKVKEEENQASFKLLPAATCTVNKVSEALKSLEKPRQSVVTLTNEVESNLLRPIKKQRIHPYLLTAILENLFGKEGNVYITLSLKDEADLPNEKLMQITAFYPNWKLPLEDEPDFLLKPLEPNNDRNRRRNGFYLTAQVLWRNGGLIEYYPLCENESPELSRAALINLTFSIG